MPALPADIAAATRAGGTALETAQDANLLNDTPNARDGADRPIAAWWDDPAAAQALVSERLSIIGAPRRRFVLRVEGLRFDLFPGATAKTVRLDDAEQLADGDFIVSRVSGDLDRHQTVLEIWG